ncbi:hypothetical protein GCM10009602_65590 [Nocardiopsis tropica]
MGKITIATGGLRRERTRLRAIPPPGGGRPAAGAVRPVAPGRGAPSTLGRAPSRPGRPRAGRHAAAPPEDRDAGTGTVRNRNPVWCGDFACDPMWPEFAVSY